MKPNAAPMEVDPLTESVRRDGYAIVRSVADAALIARLIKSCPPVPSAGVRDLLRVAPGFEELASHETIRGLVASLLGKPGFVTRAILFDKAPGANWALGFHQDVTIAVAERIDTPGFGPWSVKAGIPHVRPPASVLESMITVRIHLDECDADNGPLAVIPRSHRQGFLDDAGLKRAIENGPIVECTVAAGDAVVMRPLLLHGSRKAETPAHRRVAHFEFACESLPPPLHWMPLSRGR